MKKRALVFTLLAATAPQASSEFLRIGHRGAKGHAPENTLASFQKALDLGVNAIELDVFRCASGELVVIHDESVDRTTNGTGLVEQQTYSELQRYHALGTDVVDQTTRIPTLAQVLDLVNKRVMVNVELKGTDTAKLTAELIHNYVTQYGWAYSNFMVSSFDHNELLVFKQHAPQVTTGALFDSDAALDAAIEKSYRTWDFIAVSKKSISSQHVKHAHQKNLKVYVYTVNKPKEIARIKAMGIDGIFSDYPDLL